jgi:acyltransferase
MKERIVYYDIAKGIGIFLVVYTHIYVNTDSRLNEIIYAFYMPLFFVVSGLTFKSEENIKKYVAKNFYSIMIPYFIWSILSFTYWAVFENRFRSEAARLAVDKAFCGIFVGSYYWLPFNYVLWFLPVLFTVKVIYGILQNHLQKAGIAAAISVCAVLGIRLMNVELVWGINRTLRYIVFFAFGVIIQKIDFRKLKYKTVIWLVLFSFLSVATLLGYSIGIFYYILGIIGSVATIIIAADIEVHTRYIAKIMGKLGTITLGILVMHGSLYRALIGVTSKMFCIDTGYLRRNVLFSLSLSMITILLIVYPTRIIYKHIPFFLGRKRRFDSREI